MSVDKLRSTNPNLAGVVPYDPKYLPAEAMLSANENPDGLPPEVADAVAEALARVPLNRYPDPLANELRDEIAAAYGLARENVLVGNGGDELLFDIAFAWGGPGRTMLDLPPTFSVYAANARLCGTRVVNVPRYPIGVAKSCEVGTGRCKRDLRIDEETLVARASQGDVDYLTVCSPNNPTGDVASRDFLRTLLDATNALVLADEAYGEFAIEGTGAAPLLAEHENLAILRTFSKAYSLAGLRVGYLLAPAAVVSELCKVRQPYSVDAYAQAVALEVFRRRALFAERTAAIVAERKRVLAALQATEGVQAWPSHANFILFRALGVPGADLWQALYDQGILVRDFSPNPYTPGCLRVSMGTPDQNNAFLQALSHILEV